MRHESNIMMGMVIVAALKGGKTRSVNLLTDVHDIVLSQTFVQILDFYFTFFLVGFFFFSIKMF